MNRVYVCFKFATKCVTPKRRISDPVYTYMVYVMLNDQLDELSQFSHARLYICEQIAQFLRYRSEILHMSFFRQEVVHLSPAEIILIKYIVDIQTDRLN